MKGCWSDGELRAYVDRELPEWEQAAAHLEECAECRRRQAEIAARAQRVAGLMAGLADGLGSVSAPAPVEIRVRTPRRPARRVAAAMAIAAVLAGGLVMVSRQNSKAPAAVKGAEQPVLQAHLDAPPQAPAESRLRARPRPHAPSKRVKAQAQVQYFLALDDEPIDTGLVMRVALGDGNTLADVIVGPDGQAHAVRLLK